MFLHQTTTGTHTVDNAIRCLSSCSYIKPQLKAFASACAMSCLSSCSYIKPQRAAKDGRFVCVVYHLVPTSNHNTQTCNTAAFSLFIILFLHQTTTFTFVLKPLICCLSSCSYIKPQHAMSPSFSQFRCLSSCSYIKPQPCKICCFLASSCLSSCSYIKPQPFLSIPSSHTGCLSSCSYIKPQPIAVNLLAISKILCFKLIRNGRAGRILLQKY